MFPVALKTGRPVARQAAETKAVFVVSECPLAHAHIVQGMECLNGGGAAVEGAQHPIQLIALASGL